MFSNFPSVRSFVQSYTSVCACGGARGEFLTNVLKKLVANTPLKIRCCKIYKKVCYVNMVDVEIMHEN